MSAPFNNNNTTASRGSYFAGNSNNHSVSSSDSDSNINRNKRLRTESTIQNPIRLGKLKFEFQRKTVHNTVISKSINNTILSMENNNDTIVTNNNNQTNNITVSSIISADTDGFISRSAILNANQSQLQSQSTIKPSIPIAFNSFTNGTTTAVAAAAKTESTTVSKSAISTTDQDELDSYMVNIARDLSKAAATTAASASASSANNTSNKSTIMTDDDSIDINSTTTDNNNPSIERFYGSDDDLNDIELVESMDSADAAAVDWLVSKSKIKRKELKSINHSNISYPELKLNNWIEHPDVTALTESEVSDYRLNELEGLRVKGKDCPRPVWKWSQCGLPSILLSVIEQQQYLTPFAIQQQALPVLMSGRDSLICARTGCFAAGTEVLLYNGKSKLVELLIDNEELMGDDSTVRIIVPGSIHNHNRDIMYRIDPINTDNKIKYQSGFTVNGEHILVLKCYIKPEIVINTTNNGELIYNCHYYQSINFVLKLSIESYNNELIATNRLNELLINWQPIIYETTVKQYINNIGYLANNQYQMYIPNIIHFNSVNGRFKQLLTAVLGQKPSKQQIKYYSRLLGISLIDSRIMNQIASDSDIVLINEILIKLESNSEFNLIPHCLLIDEYCVRIELLLGLIEGLNQSTVVTVNNNNNLIQQLILLSKSIGYRIKFNQSNQISIEKLNSNNNSWSFTITPLPIDNYYGFQVAGPLGSSNNGRFLLNDYTVTHNSGKTLAFVLPMIRHVLAQQQFNGNNNNSINNPQALILSPTRELTTQIYSETKKFSIPCQLKAVCLYGGASVSDQIASVKRGCNLLICTPGRLIDLLCINNGRLLTLTNVSYVVLDEADRMFDMGFQPQIEKLLDNIRPDRQLSMFSATFPQSIERAAKKSLKNPIELIMGAASASNNTDSSKTITVAPAPTISQFVEVITAKDKYNRLIELLVQWINVGSILIFVDRQELVDELYKQLSNSGYNNNILSLHAGMDQLDRDNTLIEYKSKVKSVLITTSVLARGLDVKDLILVINYSVPNHYEDYVHRIGRTGRAGATGTAITFIQPDQLEYAPDLIKALELSSQRIPVQLQSLADECSKALLLGQMQYYSNNGYNSSKGYQFNSVEQAERAEIARLTKITADSTADRDEVSEAIEQLNQINKEKHKNTGSIVIHKSNKQSSINTVPIPISVPIPAPIDSFSQQLAAAKAMAAAAVSALANTSTDSTIDSTAAVQTAIAAARAESERKAAEEATIRAKAMATALMVTGQSASAGAAATVGNNSMVLHSTANKGNNKSNPSTSSTSSLITLSTDGTIQASVIINDYPQNARWRVTRRGALDHLTSTLDVAITQRGNYYPSPTGRMIQQPIPDSAKLALLIEGRNEIEVLNARAEIVKLLEEVKAVQSAKSSRYSVV